MNDILYPMEDLNVYNCLNPTACEDLFNGDPATDVVSMKNYRTVMFIIAKNAGATGTATITVESCDDVTPTTATAIPFRYRACTSGNTWGAVTTATASGVATTAGANQAYLVEVRSDELSGTNSFVRMQLTEVVDSPVDGDVCCIMANPRYGMKDVTS